MFDVEVPTGCLPLYHPESWSAVNYSNSYNSQGRVPWRSFKCIILLHIIRLHCPLMLALLPLRAAPVRPQVSSLLRSVCLSLMTHNALVRVSVSGEPPSQDSNSLSLLTEISGVEAPVPLRSFSVLQSLASGLPRWRGELGSKWGRWWRSWRDPSGELSEGRMEGSCCSLNREGEG